MVILIIAANASDVKNPSAKQETPVQFLGQEDTLEKGMPIHLVFLPGKSHGQRSLAGYSPWGHKESEVTERLILSLLLTFIHLPDRHSVLFSFFNFILFLNFTILY